MKNKERTFLEKSRIFLFPFKEIPKVYMIAFIVFVIWYIPGIINVVFLQKIIETLNKNNENIFYSTIFLYVIVILIYDIVFYLFRRKGWPNLVSDIVNVLQKKYLTKPLWTKSP